MKWVGDPETDLVLSLYDDSGVVVLGQVTKDGEAHGWHAYNYMNGESKRLALAATYQEAKSIVERSVRERMAQGETS